MIRVDESTLEVVGVVGTYKSGRLYCDVRYIKMTSGLIKGKCAYHVSLLDTHRIGV